MPIPMSMRSVITFLAIISAGVPAFAELPATRTAEGLLVLYTFEPSSDQQILDRSGNGEPLNLRVERPQSLIRRRGRLIVSSSASITSEKPATKIVAAIKQSGELTIEAWIKPSDTRQSGPARIV